MGVIKAVGVTECTCAGQNPPEVCCSLKALCLVEGSEEALVFGVTLSEDGTAAGVSILPFILLSWLCLRCFRDV